MNNPQANQQHNVSLSPLIPNSWIRGVNLGGWLVTERWITPYLYALTKCHLEGNFCSWPQQVNADPSWHLCNLTTCPRLVLENGKDDTGYPVDEYTLTAAFDNTTVAQLYMENHWNTFVTKQGIIKLKKAGVTHLRVPLGYWILGDIKEDEPWVPGGWKYFTRLLGWCREMDLKVWPDLHAAPGSQNGFDNSGYFIPSNPTCTNWCYSQDNIQRTLKVIRALCQAIHKEEESSKTRVVTGFGVLNEPFTDCNHDILKNYNQQALDTIRSILGPDVTVYVGDTFHANVWNDGFWLDNATHYNTLLDTHPYHVFFEQGRAMSPKEHIAYVCRKNHREVTSCCYQDFVNSSNTIPSKGIRRMVGEWSASYDVLPTALIGVIMEHISKRGVAPFLNRTLSHNQQLFLADFVQAQMVTYEAAQWGLSNGWFFWNFKMEGGAFAEWDFLRGIEEGWIPQLPPPNVSSVSLYGTCEEIVNRTNDKHSIVKEYPDPSTLDWTQWQGWSVDDDYVLSQEENNHSWYYGFHQESWVVIVFVACVASIVVVWYRKLKASGGVGNRKSDYVQIP